MDDVKALTEDAAKFLRGLLGRCQPRNGRKDGDGHDWHECDRCLRYFDLESRQPYAVKLIEAAMAALAAPRPSGEREAPASGERPAIEVGDWAVFYGIGGVRLVTSVADHYIGVSGRSLAVDVGDIHEIRKPNGVVWRKP